MDERQAIEAEFLESWDFIEQHYSYYSDDFLKLLKPLLKSIALLRVMGYDRQLRAGQQVYMFVLSRSRRHGLGTEQHRVVFNPDLDGSMLVTYWEQPNPPTEIKVEGMEVTPEVEVLLQRLLEQPID